MVELNGRTYTRREIAERAGMLSQFAGVPAALIGAALALRRNRKGHLTMALGEGFAVTIGLWTASVFSRTLAMSEHISPFWGGFGPFAVCTLLAVYAVRKWAR